MENNNKDIVEIGVNENITFPKENTLEKLIRFSLEREGNSPGYSDSEIQQIVTGCTKKLLNKTFDAESLRKCIECGYNIPMLFNKILQEENNKEKSSTSNYTITHRPLTLPSDFDGPPLLPSDYDGTVLDVMSRFVSKRIESDILDKITSSMPPEGTIDSETMLRDISGKLTLTRNKRTHAIPWNERYIPDPYIYGQPDISEYDESNTDPEQKTTERPVNSIKYGRLRKFRFPRNR